MKLRAKDLAAAAILFALSAGCAVQAGTITSTLDTNSGESFLTGARQRFIRNQLVGDLSRPGQVEPRHIICTEPGRRRRQLLRRGP